MIRHNKLTTTNRVEIHLDVLDKLKRDALNTSEELTALRLQELNTVFNLTRHGLEMEVRKLMKELNELKQEGVA